MNPVIVLAGLLAASLVGNAALLDRWLTERDAATRARVTAEKSADDAQACRDGVSSMQAAAERRAQTAESARDAALAAQREAVRLAGKNLSRPPPVPGDVCASVQVVTDEWLANRRVAP